MLKQKIISLLLVFCMVTTISVQAIKFVSGSTTSENKSIAVKNIDANNALVCYSGIGENKSILVQKEKTADNYHYVFLDPTTSKELYSFDSVKDVDFGDSEIINSGKMCAAVATLVKAVMSGEDIWIAFASVLGGAMTYISDDTVRTVGALIAECGLAAIPEIVGLLSVSEILVIVGGAVALA